MVVSAQKESGLIGIVLLLLLSVITAILGYIVGIYSPFRFVNSSLPQSITKSTISEASKSAELNLNTVVIGTVEGKLCFPSDHIPAGMIIAKNTKTLYQISQPYQGLEKEESSQYTFELPEGKYLFKFEPRTEEGQKPFSGYHSKSCPTSQDVCPIGEKRELKEIIISGEGITKNIDICDYYYGENEPLF